MCNALVECLCCEREKPPFVQKEVSCLLDFGKTNLKILGLLTELAGYLLGRLPGKTVPRVGFSFVRPIQ